MNKRLSFLVAFGAVLVVAVVFLQTGNVGTAALWRWSSEGQWLLPLVLVAAVLDSVNPCAFSILIVTIAFLFSVGKQRSGVLQIGSTYILGIFVVYSLIGLGILQTLHLFNTPHFMAKVGAAALIVMGSIGLAKQHVPALPVKLGIPQSAHQRMAGLMEKASLPSAFVLGGLVGLCEFPCTGGPYLMVLGLLHDQATHAIGLGYLFLYNVIFVVPLVIILLIASEKKLVDKVQAWKKRENRAMRVAGGIAMVGLGALIFAL
jgi:cytochrome c-type biogenesis protein